MWVVAGVLLAIVVVASLVGLHTGPHAHVIAGVVGICVAAWFVFMAVAGDAEPLLWVLLGLDVAVSAAVGVLAWSGLVGQGSVVHRVSAVHRVGSLEGVEGVAVSDLVPAGIARVQGEHWSVLCMNGTVRAGTRIQVLRSAGVRLEVWGEEADATSSNLLPSNLLSSDLPLGSGRDFKKERNT
jgi:membrane-bound ClpP family serine protease